MDRPELHRLLDQLRIGDVLVVWKSTGFPDRCAMCSPLWNASAKLKPASAGLTAAPIASPVDSSPTSSYAEVTEVRLTPDVQAKLDQLSGETGRAQDEFVRDALAGYFDELAQVRGMLDSRYDDLRSGRVALLAGEEVMAHFQEKSAARRS